MKFLLSIALLIAGLTLSINAQDEQIKHRKGDFGSDVNITSRSSDPSYHIDSKRIIFPAGVDFSTTSQKNVRISDLILFGNTEIERNSGEFTEKQENGENSFLVIEGIAVPTSQPNSKVFLEFDEIFKLEVDHDISRVLIKAGGSDAWILLEERSGTKNRGRNYFDLTNYAGSSIDLRLELVTDSTFESMGWAIHGINIISSSNGTENAGLTLDITNLNYQNFPFIFLNAKVKFNNSTVPGLDSNYLQLTENGVSQTDYLEITPPDTATSVNRLADIVFLVDNSGSFSSYQQAVYNNMIAFVNNLSTSGINYALGLCRFGQYANGGNPIIEDNGILTGDANYFKNNVWGRNVVDGGYEPAYYAITTSSSNFTFRPGSQKIFIILADEDANQGGATQAQAIAACQNNSVALYALTTAQSAGLNVVAQQTSGRYYNITDSFSDILNDISGSVSESYLIRYKSSDTTLNGITRQVRLQASYSGNLASDTTSYVPGAAPKISRTAATLALHNNPLAQNSSVTIQVNIVDNVAPFTTSAKLFFRVANTANYSVLNMTNSSGNLWQATIPTGTVLAPGIDYYITATDGQATASDPSVSPSTNPYQLAVLPNLPPVINHTPISTYALGNPVTITASASDNTNYLTSVKLFYRKIGQLVYSSVTMSSMGNNQYSAAIPSTFASADGLNYYLQATDDFGVSTFSGTADAPFSVIPPRGSISIIAPVGQQLLIFSQANIEWTSTNVDSLNILYSIDGGTIWHTVASSVPALASSFLWTVPNHPTDSCKIKLISSSNPNIAVVNNGYFSIVVPAVAIWFDATPVSGDAPLSVQFTDNSSGIILKREWDFQNDGVIDDTVKNPTFTYTNGGLYSVKLRVTHLTGIDSTVRQDLVNVSSTSNTGQPIAFYPFSGSANNQVGDYNHGLVSNAVLTTDRFGNPNSAYFFNGSNAEIIAGGNPQLENSSNHSISVWMRDSLGKLNSGIAQYCDDNGENGFGLQYASGGGKIGMWAYQGFSTGGWDAAYSDSIIRGDNKWHHMVGVRRNDTTFLYVDGSLQQSFTTHAISYNNSKIRFGNTNYWQNNQYFGGVLDDARFYNYSLSKAEIDALYREGGWGTGNSSITLQKPNGGEVWYVDSTYGITWNGTNTDSLTLEYSTDSGSTWSVIASNVQNTGEYLWRVPNTLSNNCLIRVIDPVKVIADSSDNFFTIRATPIPAAWDNFFAIARNQTNNKRFFTFQDLNRDGSGDAIIFDHPTGLLSFYINDGSTLNLKTSINVPNFIKGKLAEQNFIDMDNDGIKDMLVSFADHYGCTQNNVRIFWGSVTEPYFSANSSTSLSLSSAFCIDAYAIDYDKDGLKDVFIENAGSPEIMYKNNGSRSFSLVTTTNTPRDFGGYQTMTVGDYNNDGFEDLLSDVNGWTTGAYGVYLFKGTGNSTFESPVISSASIEPHTPVVKFQADPISDNKIDIAFNAANDGTSERTLYVGKWNPVLNNFDLSSFSLGSGSYTGVRLVQKFDWNNDSYDDIIVVFAQNTLYTYKAFINDGQGSFNSSEVILENSPFWGLQVVNFGIGGNKVALTSNDSLVIKNLSSPLFVKVISPNGGEVLNPGDIYNISWIGNSIGYLTFSYSLDGGATYTEVVNNLPASGSYAWTVPNSPSQNCLVRLFDVGMQEVINDESDGVFTIQASSQSVSVISPNGGEQLIAGSSYEIRWNSLNVQGGFVLEYSTNSGMTWVELSSNIPATQGSYLWTVPNIPSSECLIRLYEPVLQLEDRSDNVFSIITNTLIVNELLDLNDNQVPQDWNLFVRYPIVDIANGRLNAYASDADGWLEKNGTVSPGTDSISLKWDGQYLLSSWGITNYAELKLGTNLLRFTSNYSDYQPNNGRIRALLQFVSASGTNTTLFDQFFPQEFGNFYFKVTVSNNKLIFTGTRKVDNQDIFSQTYDSDTLSNFFEMSSITGLRFGVHTTTENDNWIDNLQVEVHKAQPTVDSSLVGFWTFDGGNGFDSSKYHNNASEIFGGVSFISGKKGLGANFGGTNNPGHIKIPNSTSLQFNNKLSVAFWMKFTSYNGTYNSHALIAKDHDVRGFRVQGTGTDNRFHAGFFNGPFYQSNFAIYNDYPPYNMGDWVHVAVVVDGNSGKLYFNGVLDTSVIGNQIDFTQANGLDLYFGKYSDSWYPFNGMLDEVRMYNRALSGIEIAELAEVNLQLSALTLLHPNGGDTLLVGQVDTIRWTSSNVQNVKLEYSTDGGGNWTTIIGSITATNLNYLWEIPNFPSAQCKIRISDVSNPSIADVSDNVFTIAQQFTEQTSISLTGVFYSSVSWGDYDNDGDLDILLTGFTVNFQVSKIYKNNGDGTFTEQTSVNLTEVSSGSAAWGDYDNDGDLDILLTGWTGGAPVSKIYKNNGDGTFTEQTSISLTGVFNSSVAWGDYDNDGDLDILLTGNTGSGNFITKVYKNNGDGTFTEQASVFLSGVYQGSVAWGDYDNDGDLDILLTGYNNIAQLSKIFTNNGDGTFTDQTSISLTGVELSSVSWGDYDNDGDLDVLLTGSNNNGYSSKIYKNNGDGTFTEQTSISLTGVYYSSVSWGDYDNDGDLDILLTGSTGNGEVSKIYKNNGDGTFTEQSSISLMGVGQSSVAWGDYDNDGDLDILLTGYNTGNSWVSKIYKNNITTLNTVPNTPTNITSTVNENTVTFNWNKSTDNETPQNGLHYNLVIGTTANSVNTLSPMADGTTGFRKVVRLGNSQTNSWTIKDLPVGTYYWSVQAIDGAYAGSQFAPVDSFIVIIPIPSVPTLVSPGNNYKGLQNPITAKWNKSPRVEKYRFQISTDSLFGSLVVNDSTLTDTVKLLPTLANYSQYYWRVKAVNIGGESDWSMVWNFKTLGNPYASNLVTPLDASLNQPSTGLTFKWTKAKERIETIQKYQFQISTDSLFGTFFVNDSTLTDTIKVVNGMGYLTKYFWRVRAQNQTGWGDWSNTWRFTTIIDKPIVPVLALPVNGDKGLLNPITTKWNKSLRVEKYKLQVSTDNLFSSLIVNDSTLTDTTKLLPNLANYSQYYWRVKAVNVGGESDWSTVWNFKTLGNPYASNLVLPLDNSFNHPLNGLTFKWTKAKERIETIQKYQFQISTDSLFASVFVNDSTLTDTSKVVGGMGYLTKYFWRVRAQNQTGWGDWSNTWRFSTIIEKPSIPVLALPANGGKGLLNPITAKWNKSLRVEKYKLQVSTDNLFSSLIVNDSTLADTTRLLPNLANYSQYYWRVKAVNVGGESDWSTVWNFKTLGNPYASNLIAPLDAAVNQPANGLTFKWTKAIERIESIQKYQLQISTDSLFASMFVNDSTLTDTTKVVGGMGYLTKYFWKVRAQNQTGWGEWSNTNRFTTATEQPTVPVLALPANGSKGLLNPITTKWNKSLRVEKYKLQVSSDNLFSSLIVNDSTLTDTTKVLPNLANYSHYYWRVKAVNVGGESDWSTVWNFKTLGNPYASNLITPLDASVNQPVAGLTFKWTKAQERMETIQKYQLQISTDSLFASTFVNDSTLTDTTKVVGGMGYLTKYFWRVRAQNQTGWGDWSNIWRFTTIIEKPSIPLLASPVNNATQQLQPVVLKWKQSLRVEKYTLEVSESSNFTTLFLVDSTMTDTMRTLPQLQTPKTYYWRVKATNLGGTSEYSTVWNFRTLGFPIAVNLIAPENGSVNLPINDVLLKWSTAGEQTLGSVTSGGKGVNKAKGDMEPSIDGEGQRAPRSGHLLTSGSANPISGIESIGKYWLEIKTDTNSTTLFYSDSTLTDTTKLMSGFGYLTTYYWRVKANNEVGWGSFSGWFRFTTVTERPGITVLSSPSNNSLGLIQPVMVKWNSSQRVERYTLEVSSNALFTTVVFKDTTIVDTLKTLPQLSPLTTYYWRVSARNTGGVSDTSTVWNFKTLGTPTVVTLVTPENNAVNVPISNILFNWTKAIDRLETIQRYRFELKTDTTSSTFVVIDTLLTDTTKIVATLQNLTDYYWRISAKNEAGWGEFTGWNRFTTIISAPNQAVLTLPANNAIDVPIKPVFKWNSIVGAEKYHLQVATDLNFTNIVLLDSMLTDTTKTLTTDSLNYKTKYYWRVKAQNIGGTGIYSVVWNFTTKKKPIATPTALTATATAVKRVTLSWADNSDNELGFIILRKTGDSTSTASLLQIDTVGVDVTEFIDSTVTDTSYYSYRVMAYNLDTLSTPSYYATVFTLTGIKEFAGDIPKEFTLYQNYPNPFNPSTIIRFALPKDAHVEIELYSIHGELMKKLVSEDKQAGYYEISLEIPSYASGIYFYRIVASPGDNSEPFVQTRKFILMK